MNRIGVVGIDWRQQGPSLLVPYTVPADERAERLPALAREIDARELVYLATCNRVEAIFVARRGVPLGAYRGRVFRALRGRAPEPREAEVELRAWGGEGAAEHLFLLAAGLESAMMGEREIVGQMREALQGARKAGTSGPLLEGLFAEAWKVARRVHAATALGDGKLSLAELALARVRERLARRGGAVALVGVSQMTLHCGRALAADGVPVLVFNRTLERAASAAAELGGSAHRLDALGRELPHEVAAVVCATGAPQPVLRRPDLERLAATASGHPPLIVDLAVPPDVDAEDARLAGLERVSLEEILEEAEAHRRARREHGDAAREIVERALRDLDAKLVDQLLAPMFAALQRRYQVTARQGVERLLRKDLGDLDPGAEAALNRWAEVLARRFAHLPTTGLRAVARTHGFEAVESFFAQGDAVLRRELARIGDDEDRLLPDGLRRAWRDVVDPVPS